MQGKSKQRWLELCVEVVVEEDPERLMELAWEINQLLAEEELRLKQLAPAGLPANNASREFLIHSRVCNPCDKHYYSGNEDF